MRICRFLIIVAILVLACPGTRAQFKRDAFTQNYSDLKDTTARKDSIDKMFSFKEFFRGVSHKQELLPGTLFAGSMLFIGSQQIYHKDYWKLPIIYGGFLGCVYALTWNGQMLSDYSQAYLDIMDSDPNTKSYEKMLPPNYSIVGKEERFKGIFKSKKDTYRRFRDLSIFAFGGVYLLSVIDAYVDAELSTFDISHDLSLEIHPTMIETGRFDMHHRTTTPGVQCVINF